MMSTQTGIFEDVPDAEYRAIEAYGSSVVKAAAMLSVAHATVKTPDSPAMFKGRLAHCMFLEPDQVDLRYERQLVGHGASKAVKEDKARIIEAGKTPVSASDWDAVSSAVAASKLNPNISTTLDFGAPEVTVVWKDKLSGLMCKARVDWLDMKGSAAFDLKTTSTFGGAAPNIWTRQVRRYGLGIQAVHYLDGLSQLTGQLWDWRWIALELVPPFGCTIFEPDHDVYADGLNGWRRGLSRLKESEVAGHDLAWPQRTYKVSLDGWR
jgi:hypothetical protein